MWWNKRTKVPKASYQIEDRDEEEYRRERIRQIVEGRETDITVLASNLDRWVIHEVNVTSWDDDGEDFQTVEYIPTPLWDDEWLMSRNSYPTLEQAQAYVNRIGGSLVYPE